MNSLPQPNPNVNFYAQSHDLTNNNHENNVFIVGFYRRHDLKRIKQKQLRPLKEVVIQSGFYHFPVKTCKSKATVSV